MDAIYGQKESLKCSSIEKKIKKFFKKDYFSNISIKCFIAQNIPHEQRCLTALLLKIS